MNTTLHKIYANFIKNYMNYVMTNDMTTLTQYGPIDNRRPTFKQVMEENGILKRILYEMRMHVSGGRLATVGRTRASLSYRHSRILRGQGPQEAEDLYELKGTYLYPIVHPVAGLYETTFNFVSCKLLY